LRVNALELLRQPGASRPVEAEIAGDSLDVVHQRLAGDVTVDVELEALTDGITVRGEVRCPSSGVCRRCLAIVDRLVVAAVDELYQTEPTHDDAFPIEHDQLDLAPMARQLLLLELDDEPLCRPDCAGLCPVCGVDLNVEACDCDTSVRDERWAALDDLVLDDRPLAERPRSD
jgi:uncharacterized protein